MNAFDGAIERASGASLHGVSIDTVQVNVGLRCNLACRHCHVGAAPSRDEIMDEHTMGRVVEIICESGCTLVDITGGAPEMHPNLKTFIEALIEEAVTVQVRTNFAALLEPGNEGLPLFFRERGVRLVGSMPGYLREKVDAQRGHGTYDRCVKAIRWLNQEGYGKEPSLPLDLVYNPGGAFLPPAQEELESDYRRELHQRFGISFSRLLTIANMPVGRFLDVLREQGEEKTYRDLLVASFNPATIPGLMCRRQVTARWDGTLYDCDFNLALDMPLDHGASCRIGEFDADRLSVRRIVTGEHCFGCTAGHGSSCQGALT